MRGISYLLIELDQPGISIRPLKQMNGGNDFNEVFFDDAETPDNMLVGARGKGWTVSKSLLKHERNRLGGVDRSEGLFASLLKLAQRARIGDGPAIEDRALRERLGRLRSRLEVQRMSANIQLSRDLEGKPQGLLPLTNKLAQSDFSQAVAEVAMELVGDDALLAPGVREPQGDERWLNHYMASLSAAIAGGTSNIQRNIIAERGLGLPRDKVANA
jgi:alkylation response protein AidB-like acyl-CoA dehydrogenase